MFPLQKIREKDDSIVYYLHTSFNEFPKYVCLLYNVFLCIKKLCEHDDLFWCDFNGSMAVVMTHTLYICFSSKKNTVKNSQMSFYAWLSWRNSSVSLKDPDKTSPSTTSSPPFLNEGSNLWQNCNWKMFTIQDTHLSSFTERILWFYDRNSSVRRTFCNKTRTQRRLSSSTDTNITYSDQQMWLLRVYTVVYYLIGEILHTTTEVEGQAFLCAVASRDLYPIHIYTQKLYYI